MKQKLSAIKDIINAACDAAGRLPTSVCLIAVSKNRAADKIKMAMDLGITHFGENRVQDAAAKWQGLKQSGIYLHLIGPLQTNKVKAAMAIFDAVHTLDRLSLAQEMVKQNWTPPCFVQVNTGEEPQKSGVMPQALDEFMASLQTISPLNIEGLMCIPPANQSASLHFAFLAARARHFGLGALSMGMSNDFASAIKCGATHIRIGSALFDDE